MPPERPTCGVGLRRDGLRPFLPRPPGLSTFSRHAAIPGWERAPKNAGDEVKLVFDGAGVEWVPKLLDEDHGLNPKFEKVPESVHGACQFCANAFHVRTEIEETDVPLLDEHNRHPDIHALVADGYETITF